MAVELGYFVLSVTDVERARTFYGRLFGWEFDAVKNGYAHVNNTKLPLGLFARGPAKLGDLYFRVADLRAVLSLVSTLGGSAKEPQLSPSGTSAVCTDDQGTEFGIWEPADGL